MKIFISIIKYIIDNVIDVVITIPNYYYNKNKLKIYYFICENPGISATSISKTLNIKIKKVSKLLKELYYDDNKIKLANLDYCIDSEYALWMCKRDKQC